MSEVTIVDRIIRAALRERDLRRAAAVECIDVEVGELEGICEEDLKRAFDVRVEGSPLRDTVLHVTVVKAKAFCPICGKAKYHAVGGNATHNDEPPVCPDCGGYLEVEEGQGFKMRSATLLVPV